MKQSLLIWGSFLILGFPILTLVLGELQTYLKRKSNPLEAFVDNLQKLVLPPLVILVILERLLNLATLGIALQILKTVLWVAIAYTTLALLRAVLLTTEKQYRWQITVPNLFFQVIRSLIVLGIGAHIVTEVWQFDLTQIAAALGVGSIVVALALQDTLSNLVSGFLLLLESPFQKGDWISADGTDGQVIEMNWRAVRLLTFENNILTIPNGSLGKNSILNYNRPNLMRWLYMQVQFSYDDHPNKVEEILRQAWKDTGRDDEDFWPLVSSYDDSSITYNIWYAAEEYMNAFSVGSTFKKRIYYLAKRHGLTIPYPISHTYYTKLSKDNLEDNTQKIIGYLRLRPYFAMLETETLEQLAFGAAVEYYGVDEQVIHQGKYVQGFYIVEQGSAIVTLEDMQGNQQTVAYISPGDFFGETVLMSGKPSDVSVSATSDLIVIRLKQEKITNLIAERPLFSKQIDELINERRKTIRRLRGEELQEAESLASDRALNGRSILRKLRS
ncbi:MAG: mechanosensitive ion channel [Leptolyngbya sp. SIO1E4]|nr:mechanosensitive ion channel [Leptolyngbya sp. SIO1E4]